MAPEETGARGVPGLVRLLPRFARDASTRAAVALGAGALVSLPLVSVLRGWPPGGGAGATPDGTLASAMEPALSLALALAALLLAAGSVSEPLRRGWCRAALVRPAWRPGWFLARTAGALAWIPVCAVALHALLDVLAGPGRLSVPPGGALPGAVAWAAVAGAPTFALSCLLRRGDGLAAAALLLLPALLASLGGPESGPVLGALDAVAPPVSAARRILEAGLAGELPAPGRILEVAAHGSAWVLVGVGVLSVRRLTPE